MRRSRSTSRTIVPWCACVLLAGSVCAEDVQFTQGQRDALRQAWDDLPRHADLGHTSVEQYRRMLRDWATDKRVVQIFDDAAFQQKLLDERATVTAEVVKDERLLAHSVNAASTNPRSVGLVERTGIVDRLTLALEGTNPVSANDTAITLNLSAAAMFFHPSEKDADATATARYRHKSSLSRLGGSVTFGAKLPEKDITGFSGLPDADKLFDTLSWDVKWRLFGDRDPRATRWEDQLFYLSSLNYADAFGAPAVAPPGTIPIENTAFDDAWKLEAGDATTTVLGNIKRSWQGSLKLAGQHLSTERGMDKYSGVLLVDGGLGPADVTLNASYSATQDVTAGTAQTFVLKQWKLAGAFSWTVMKDVLVVGRGSPITLSAEGLFPRDGRDVPLHRKRTWKADLAVAFPVNDTLQIPLSITFTNDPNSLKKERFVKGQIGINYDFGAIKALLGYGNRGKTEMADKKS
jgi:hypothetical protein